MSLEVDMDLFIDSVQQYPHLYDIKDKNYKNNDLKEKCWETVSAQVHIAVDDCKRLWKNLRDRFNKEKRLQLDSDAKESTWPYFSKMIFYAKYSMPRKTIISTSRPSLDRSLERPIPSTSSSSENRLWSPVDLTPSEVNLETKEEDDFTSTSTPTDEPSTSFDTSRTNVTTWAFGELETSPKKIKQERVQQEITEVSMPIISGFTSIPAIPKNDVNDNFGAYVVSRLKEMNPEIARQKRKKMLLILEEDD